MTEKDEYFMHRAIQMAALSNNYNPGNFYKHVFNRVNRIVLPEVTITAPRGTSIESIATEAINKSRR
jgi:hypothetical protein